MAAARIELTAHDVAAAAGGTLVSGGARPLVRFATDTRTLAEGDVFIALRGDRFDGHAFAADALRRGAAGAIVDRRSGLAAELSTARADAVVIEVDDTLAALQALAHEVRRRSGARVVAITGSAGKTTTKELAAACLATRYRVFRNAGNLNNHVGLPLSLLQLVDRPDVAVVELGMNHHGELRRLVAIAEPDVRVWTNVGDAHLGHFASADDIALAKAEVLEGAAPASLLVANADDERVMRHAAGFAGRIATFGLAERADVRATAVEDAGTAGVRATVETPAGRARVHVPLLGLGNLMNALAAAAVALEYDVPLDAVASAVSTAAPAKHRGQVTTIGDGTTIVDDSYNSSPAALARALEAIAHDRPGRRRVAVLGEMLELGRFSEQLHEASGEHAARAGVSVLVAVGGAPARRLAESARAAGVADVHYVQTSAEAADLVAPLVRPGDLVLVKGSRGIGTDLVVDRLQAGRS